jgi:hypothetical protein
VITRKFEEPKISRYAAKNKQRKVVIIKDK